MLHTMIKIESTRENYFIESINYYSIDTSAEQQENSNFASIEKFCFRHSPSLPQSIQFPFRGQFRGRDDAGRSWQPAT